MWLLIVTTTRYAIKDDILISKSIISSRRIDLHDSIEISTILHTNNVSTIYFKDDQTHIVISDLIMGFEELLGLICNILKDRGYSETAIDHLLDMGSKKFKLFGSSKKRTIRTIIEKGK